jgi:toxin ParE1/3/4
MRRTRLSAKARADLDEIWLYVAERDGPDAADRLIDRLTATFPLLAAYPAMGKSRDDLHPGCTTVSS